MLEDEAPLVATSSTVSTWLKNSDFFFYKNDQCFSLIFGLIFLLLFSQCTKLNVIQSKSTINNCKKKTKTSFSKNKT